MNLNLANFNSDGTNSYTAWNILPIGLRNPPSRSFGQREITGNISVLLSGASVLEAV